MEDFGQIIILLSSNVTNAAAIRETTNASVFSLWFDFHVIHVLSIIVSKLNLSLVSTVRTAITYKAKLNYVQELN